MKQFTYTITDSIGIHARPAGLLVKAARAFASTITVETAATAAGPTKLLALLRRGAKLGDCVTVRGAGAAAEAAAAAMEQFFQENL